MTLTGVNFYKHRSVGVIAYVLLSGLSPFLGDSDAETCANVTRAEPVTFDDDPVPNAARFWLGI